MLTLKNGPIENPGLAKLEAIAGAMGSPPTLWFDHAKSSAPDAALAAAMEDKTAPEILEEILKMQPRHRRLLGIARQISPLRGTGRS